MTLICNKKNKRRMKKNQLIVLTNELMKYSTTLLADKYKPVYNFFVISFKRSIN